MKINSIGGSAIQVQIDGEDYSVADIVHKELLSVKHVKFAGVAPPHPLIKTLTIQLHSDGPDENELLKEAVTNATQNLGEILEASKQAFPDAVIPRPISSKSEESPGRLEKKPENAEALDTPQIEPSSAADSEETNTVS